MGGNYIYGYIYLTENLIDNRKYIGQHRASEFEPEKYLGSGVVLLAAIKKYGKQNFKCTLLEECSNEEELNEREVYWIAYYNAVEDPIFYNLAYGGDANIKGLETRMKMSMAQKGKKRGPVSEITRQKIGKSNKGKKSIPIQCLETGKVFNSSGDVVTFYNLKNKGKALESARAIQNNINHTFNSLHWAIIKDINSPYSADERKKILENLPPSPTRKGHKNDPNSKTHNREYLEKPIQCIEDLRVFKNSKEASIFYGIDFRRIRMIARDIEKGIYHKNFKLNFIYLKNNTPYTSNQLSDIIKNLKIAANAKKVQSLETGLVFESATVAGNYFNIKGTLISDCARKVTKGIGCKSINQHWIYLENDVPYSEIERLEILSSLKKRKEVENCLL